MLFNYELSIFDMTSEKEVTLDLFTNEMRGVLFYEDSPLDLIEIITNFTGRMKPSPRWASEGAIVGLEGGSDIVINQTNYLLS